MLAWLIGHVLRQRLAVMVGLFVVVIAALLGLMRLRLDFSSTAFYGDGSTDAEQLADFQRRWGADDGTLLVLVHTDEDDPHTLLEPARLQAIAQLEQALAGATEVASTRSIARLRAPIETPVGTLEADTWLAWIGQQPETSRSAWLERLPFVPTLLSADGRDTVIVVELGFSSDDVVRTRSAVDELDGILQTHAAMLAEHGLRHELAGVPAIRAAFFELIVRDQSRFVPLTLAIIGLALLWVFGRVHGVVIPALAAAVPTAMLVGIMGWAGEPLGLLNQAYFTLLPVIAVADAIHMVARYHEQRRADPGGDREQAIVHACAQVGLACLLTSLTTATGFASLLLADMPILRGFGLFAAVGVGLAFVVGVVLVPISLSLVRDDRLPRREIGLDLIDRVVAVALRRPRLVVLVSLALMGLAWLPATRVRIDNTLSGLLETSHPVSVASARVDARLGGVLGLELELLARDGEDLRTPERLARTAELEAWLAEQEHVRAVEGLATVVAQIGQLRAAAVAIPTTQAELDARLSLLAEHAPLERLVSADGQALRIHVGMPDIGGRRFVELATRVERELEARFGAANIDAHVTGTALIAYRGVNGITDDLRSSFALVFVVVVGLIALSFRSLWPAVAAILPNLGPLLLGYAALGLLGRVLDPLAATILTLALGIAVDDTLHVMVRTREALRGGDNLEQAMRAAIRHSGWAVAVTSIVVVGGLLLNLGSSFPPLSLLGLLGSLVIALALVANLTLLPATLVLLRGRGLLD